MIEVFGGMDADDESALADAIGSRKPK